MRFTFWSLVFNDFFGIVTGTDWSQADSHSIALYLRVLRDETKIPSSNKLPVEVESVPNTRKISPTEEEVSDTRKLSKIDDPDCLTLTQKYCDVLNQQPVISRNLKIYSICKKEDEATVTPPAIAIPHEHMREVRVTRTSFDWSETDAQVAPEVFDADAFGIRHSEK